MSRDKLRVCIIGAGPSGMSVLYQFNQLKAQGEQLPEVVCFEKQSDWGGLWNFSDETGKTGRNTFDVDLPFETTASAKRNCGLKLDWREIANDGQQLVGPEVISIHGGEGCTRLK